MSRSHRQPVVAVLRTLWASPCSLIGALIGMLVLAVGGSARRVDNTVEIALGDLGETTSAIVRRCPFAALTLGHVILGVSHADLGRLRAHERTHVRQCERWGPLFLVVYPAASLFALLRGRHLYRDNRFEIEARRADAAAPVRIDTAADDA